jgi:hypothetical protein
MSSESPSKVDMAEVPLWLDVGRDTTERLPDTLPLTPVDTGLRFPPKPLHVNSSLKSWDAVDENGAH